MGRNWLPRAGASLHFLFPPSILHNGRILLVLRVVNKSVNVTMIIIIMISLKEFSQLNYLKMTILLHFVFLFFVGYSCLLRWPVYLLSGHLFSFPSSSWIISSSWFFCPMLQFSQLKNKDMRVDICVLIAGLRCCTAETSTTL